MRFDDLIPIDRDLGRCRGGEVAEHQGIRERPRLTGDVANVIGIETHRDPDFLGYLTPHCLLRGFPRLDESSEGGEPSGLPPALTPKQGSILAVDHEHDDRRICSREMLRVISRAAPCPASIDGLSACTASRTVGMAA